MTRIGAGRMQLILAWLILSTFATAAEPPSPADSALAERLSNLFQIGYARGPKAFDQVQSLYESLSKDSKQDPRVDYAHGLVLLRLMKNKEAREQFLVATKREGTPYWPAWEAVIWSEFNSKDYAAGYPHLLEFAHLIQTSTDLSIEGKQDAIYWMGRVMAALELTLDSAKNRDTWLHWDARLTDQLQEDEMDDFNRGKEDAHAQHALLEQDVRSLKEKAKKQQEETLQKRQKQIDKSLDAVKTKRDSLKKSAAEMKEVLTEQSESFQKQMARLEKEYTFLERRSAVLVTTMAGIDQEILVLQRQRRNVSNNNLGDLDRAISALQSQRLIYSAEFMKVSASADQVSANARALAQERAEFLDEYQRATGEIVDADTETEKWKTRTLNQEKALKKAKASAKPPVPAAKIQMVKTFRTYLDLDLLSERDQVLASFGAEPADK